MQYTSRFSSLATAVLPALLMLAPYSAGAAVATVFMTNQFSPQSVTVNQGDTITWINQGTTVNTATADSGLFDSGPIQPAQQFSATFNQSGIYAYHSTYSGNINGIGMSGTIVVNAAGVASAGTYSGAYANPNANFYAATNPPAYTGTTGSTAQLYAQVQSLLAQIQALQAQGGGGGTGTPIYTGTTGISSVGAGVNSSACPLIGRVLKLGSTGDDVTRLQQFLARDPSVYPEAVVSGYYGALTQAAVQRWQTKYNIVSSGTPDTTGFGVAGPRTAAAISLQCSTAGGGASGGGTGGGTIAPVGGFIQVTPVAGNAPLSVSVTATVNTGGSCVGATYVLNFGDGTVPQQIPTSSGNCNQLGQTYQHTYVYGGVYQVTLSAGSHTTNATVTVSGPAAPAGSGGGGTANQPKGTISAFTKSGNAPLSVAFYVSCAAGTAYNVVFGDGTDLGSTAVSGTKCGSGGLDAISHTYTKSGSYQAQLVIFSQQSDGTVTPTNSASVTINVSNVADSYSYNPPQLSPGSTAFAYSVQFDLPTQCTGYDVSWGDGTADAIQPDGGASCVQTATVRNVSHTYAQAGSYTIVVRRGASLSQVNDLGVNIVQ